MKKYKTIVIDPPWPLKVSADRAFRDLGPERKAKFPGQVPLPYKTMSLDEIKQLPIPSADDSVLALWVINKYIPEAYQIVKHWGFRPVQLLTWCKTPMGSGLGGDLAQTTEHILYCKKGRPKIKIRLNTNWWNWKRVYGPNGPISSKKPEDLQTILESLGEEPRLEMFARRKRAGWDVWGDEVQSDIDLYFNQNEERVLGTAA